jgi:hypothetical protein
LNKKMKKYILPIIILGIILSFASAVYTPPSATNITLILTPPYSAPSYTNITLILIGGNAAPEVQNLAILPSTPFTTDDLECSFITSDFESDKTNATVRWYNNSKPALTRTLNNNYGNGTAIKANLTAGNTTKTESWLCEIWLYDGQVNSTLVNSSAVTIQNTLPAVTNITITPNPAYNNDTPNCSATYSDADLDQGNVTFSWYNGSTLYWQTTQFNKLNNEVVNEPLTWFNKTGLVAYWKFSEGNGTQTRDISGNENNGTLSNETSASCFSKGACPSWNSSSKFGYGLEFDGLGDYVNVNDANSLDIGTFNFTISAWIKTNVTAFRIILSKGQFCSGDSANCYRININSDGTFGAYIEAGDGDTFVAIDTGEGSARIDNGLWHHIVAVYNRSGNLTTYIDGSFDASKSIAGESATLSNTNPLYIGRRPPAGNTYFNGTLDEVMVYNRSLSSGEISEIYNNSPQAKGETWNCTINATDSQGDAGLPNSTTRTISNAIPDVPEIGGPENATRTIGNSQTLRCANSSDTDGDTINYVFYMDTNTPSTTMRQNSTATTYTFSTNDGWTYYWRCKAEDGAGGVSAFTTQKTFTENTQPTSVNMVYPADGNSITNRTPQLNWSASTDAEGDSITYQINATCYPSCSADNRLPNSSINENWITITSRLKNFWDDNYYYNWTVRPWDGYEFGAWNSVPYALKLSSLVSLSMINSSVNFSVLSMGDTANTTTNNPVPLSIRNDGNSFVSVNMSNETSLLWASQPTASEYFRYRIDNVTGEENSFNWTLSTTAWTNVPTSNNTVINYLNYTDATDSAEIEILVTVPPQELAGTKSSRLVFTGFYIREI